ncbi:LysM peptidoglycan-binding domain-containing protein [Streptomyces sp. NPDC058874]|uniref:LysM peptidoglycan-binding domain-containing protein n=1 Tax=unclassified Streptomyces TaxID=2593676 RepID=UPI0036B77F6F
MGLFDFLKSDRHKADEAAAKAREQVVQQPDPAARPPAGSAADAAAATKAAAERMAAAAPARPSPATPTPASAAHKAVPAAPRPATRPKPAPLSTARGAAHTPTPHSAAHKAVPAAPVARPPVSAGHRTYTVRAGDSLAGIAHRELGNEARWRELYAMNRGVIGDTPDRVSPGMVLTLPT